MGIKVPMKPPEGLLDYAKSFLEGKHGLLYEAVWIPDWSLESVLTDKGGRKKKFVRCRCSACGNESLESWAQIGDPKIGYGFVDYEVDGLVGSGDTILCPECGAEVEVRKAATLGRNGWFVSAETSLASAAVVGMDRKLVLTMWNVQRRVYRDGSEKLSALACEAYVFGKTDCEKLTAWVTGYGGIYGYRTFYRDYWVSAKTWSEDWGSEYHIFGLTPELIAGSCLPNCKLDVYMNSCSGLCERYPVAYLRLFQRHPNVENLLLSGLPLVLYDLLQETAGSPDWKEKNRFGLPNLPEIDWDAARPSQMLRLTRDELRAGQEIGWGAYYWRLYLRARDHGEILKEDTFREIFELGEDHLLDLVGKAPVARIVQYIRKQYDVSEYDAMLYEDETGDPPDWDLPDGAMLRDYWDMCKKLDKDLNDGLVRWPRNLTNAHDKAAVEYLELQDRAKAECLRKDFEKRAKVLERFSFEHESLMIIPARSPELLKREGKMQHHCVWSYAEGHAKGKTAIFFIRRTAAPSMPYYTLELDETKMTVRQNRGLRNCARTEEIAAFEALWLQWIRAGCKRTKDGAPVLPKQEKVRMAV